MPAPDGVLAGTQPEQKRFPWRSRQSAVTLSPAIAAADSR